MRKFGVDKKQMVEVLREDEAKRQVKEAMLQRREKEDREREDSGDQEPGEE